MNNNFFLYYSQILGRVVRDERNRRIGYLSDIIMKVSTEIYPKAAQLVVRRGLFRKEFAKLEWESVKEIGEFVKVRADLQTISFERKRSKGDLTLCIDILDQQIVDVDNHKVVRVNDVHLLRVDNNLYLAHVDVGTRGLVRRLEWTPFIDGIVRFFSPHSAYLNQEELISWKNAQVLTVGQAKGVLRLDVARKKLAQIPPTELADIMEDLDIFGKRHLFKSLDETLQRKVFADLTTAKKAEFIGVLEEKEVVSLLENIPSDEAADLLMGLPPQKTRQLMKVMETKTSKKLRKLLSFAEDTAGGMMTTEYLSMPDTTLVSEAIKKIKESTHSSGNIYYIFIVNEQNKLVGVTQLRNFINSASDALITSNLDPHNVFVRTSDGIEKVALLLEKYKVTVIPVLNEDDILQGVITIDDVMEELISLAWHKYKEKL